MHLPDLLQDNTNQECLGRCIEPCADRRQFAAQAECLALESLRKPGAIVSDNLQGKFQPASESGLHLAAQDHRSLAQFHRVLQWLLKTRLAQLRCGSSGPTFICCRVPTSSCNPHSCASNQVYLQILLRVQRSAATLGSPTSCLGMCSSMQPSALSTELEGNPKSKRTKRGPRA